VKKELWSWVRTFVLAIVIALLVRKYVFALYVVEGSSMQPTLADGQVLMVNNFHYRFWQPKRGDVVVFARADLPVFRRGSRLTGGNALVKRIVGLPGETVYISDGKVYVDGEPLNEDYVNAEITGTYGPWVLDEGHYFVLGDNRMPRGSEDSRSFGPISIGDIIGRADFIILPAPKKVE